MSLADWQTLSTCLWGAGGGECGYRPLYTSCPAPGAGPQGDGYAPEQLSTTILAAPAGETAADRVLRISWRYLNAYGNVPQRDDVRFDLAIKEISVPADGDLPTPSDYPGEEDIDATEPTHAANFAASGSMTLIRNASYRGHPRFTDPVASTDLRDYTIDVPASCDRRYLVRLLPKRFCFDQTKVAQSETDYLSYVDIRCH
jgi:hypothetical protein